MNNALRKQLGIMHDMPLAHATLSLYVQVNCATWARPVGPGVSTTLVAIGCWFFYVHGGQFVASYIDLQRQERAEMFRFPKYRSRPRKRWWKRLRSSESLSDP